MARKVQGVVCPNCGSPLFANVEGVSGDSIVVCRDESEDPPTGCQAAWDLEALKADDTDQNTGPVQDAEAAPDIGPPPPPGEETQAPEVPAEPPTPAEAGANATPPEPAAAEETS